MAGDVVMVPVDLKLVLVGGNAHAVVDVADVVTMHEHLVRSDNHHACIYIRVYGGEPDKVKGGATETVPSSSILNLLLPPTKVRYGKIG